MTCRSSSGLIEVYKLYGLILPQLAIVAFALTGVVAGCGIHSNYKIYDELIDYRPVFVLHRTGELSEVIRSAILKAGYLLAHRTWYLISA